MKSPQTDSYDLLEVMGDWSIWTGIIESGVPIAMSVNLSRTVTFMAHAWTMGFVIAKRIRLMATVFTQVRFANTQFRVVNFVVTVVICGIL